MIRYFAIILILIPFILTTSCEKTAVVAGFEDMEQLTIFDYLDLHKDEFSSFIAIIKAGNLENTMGAYNPNGLNYTLFAPTNAAVDEFLKEKNITLDALLKDKDYVYALARYHIVNKGISTFDFPFGTFSEPTLTEDFLNVNFIFDGDSTYYKINNQAPVTQKNIELSNGYVHVISKMLMPITMNSYEWLKGNKFYSILMEAFDATGYNKIIDVDMTLENQQLRPFTILAEPDSVYKKAGIMNFNDLAGLISPGRNDYSDPSNPLYLYVGYHILTESKFLDDLEGKATNYNTFANVPVFINGSGLDIIINEGKEVFDQIITGPDTLIIDYVGFYYDACNVITQSGAIHFIDQVLKPQIASRAMVMFDFTEEPLLEEYRRKGGSFLLENQELLLNLKWKGSKLYYVKSLDESERAIDKDYIQIDGYFTLTYQLPKIIQGKYNVIFSANSYNKQNALIELYIDDNKLGGLIDLTKGGNSSNPYVNFKAGAIDFKKYTTHTVTIRTLVPGKLIWDYIKFEPA